MRKLWIVCLLSVSVLLLIGCQEKSTAIDPAKPIVFQDEVVEQIFRDYLGLEKESIYPSMLAEITEMEFELAYNSHYVMIKDQTGSKKISVPLDAKTKEIPRIKSLEDLRYCNSMETITGGINASIVTQLEFTTHMAKLKVLDVRGTTGAALIIRGAGLEGLSKCTNLEKVVLSVQNKSSLKPLENLQKLKSIALYGGYVEDLDSLTKLSDLQKIEYIYFSNKNTVMPRLSALNDLQHIKVANCSDFSGLIDANNVTYLCIWPANEQLSLAPLSYMNNLQTLSLRGDYAQSVADHNNTILDGLKAADVRVEIN